MEHPSSSTTEIFRQLYLDRKERNTSYSTRAFARDLGLSQAYVSLMLSGKKKLTLKQATRVAALLNLEPTETELLLNSILSVEKGKRGSKRSIEISLSRPKASPWFTDLQLDHFVAMSNWYYLPILDLSTTKNFKSDANFIARRLKITPIEARQAIERLVRMGLLEKVNGQLRKTKTHFYLETKKSLVAVRKFHKEMIAKAVKQLDQTSNEEFNRRSITGLTLAVDIDKIDQGKKLIQKFQQEISELLTGGNCTEVYQLNVQFFPLTGGEKA